MERQKKPEVRVLLIEDNKLDASVIEGRLFRAEHTKFVVHREPWLRTAIEYLAHHPVDVVLLDLKLPDPGCVGIDTFFALEPHVPNRPIVILSGNEDFELSQTALDAGAQDFILKSMDLTSQGLERRIRTAILRKKREVTRTRLSTDAMGLLGGGHSEIRDAPIIDSYLRQIETAVANGLIKLMRNAPASHEMVLDGLKTDGMYHAIGEIRAIIGTDTLDPIHDTAARALDILDRESADEIHTEEQAESFLADYLDD